MKIIFICLLLIGILYLLNTSVAVAGLEQPKYELISKTVGLRYDITNQLMWLKQQYRNPFLQVSEQVFDVLQIIFWRECRGTKKNLDDSPVISTMPNQESVDVLFVMPQSYSLQTLPQPNLSNVELHKEDWSDVAVYRFGGWATEEQVIKSKRDYSIFWMNEESVQRGEWRVAQFNPPMIPPPFEKMN